ncbi:RHS repeat-associated core domain-containing protein [Colwellia sp. E150_009]
MISMYRVDRTPFLLLCLGIILIISMFYSIKVLAEDGTDGGFDTSFKVDLNQAIREIDSVENFEGSINLQNGQFYKTQVDIELPGNSLLPVTISRTYSSASRQRRFEARDFGDWVLDTPKITAKAKMSNGTIANSWGDGTECSSYGNEATKHFTYPAGEFWPDNDVSETNTTLDFSSFWQGDTLSIPNVIDATILVKDGNSRFIKPDWKIECFNRTSGGFIGDNLSGEGFTVTSPKGVVYTFSQLRIIRSLNYGAVQGDSLPEIFEGGPIWSDWLSHDVILEMLVTRVEDRFGNNVVYSYSADGDLESIKGSDGRLIELTYVTEQRQRALAAGHIQLFNSGDLLVDNPLANVVYDYYAPYSTRFSKIKTVTANNRIWTYDYETVGDITSAIPGQLHTIPSGGHYDRLTKVTQPDNRFWKYNLSLDMYALPNASAVGLSGSEANDCSYKERYNSDDIYDASSLASYLNGDASSWSNSYLNDGKAEYSYIISPAGVKVAFLYDTKLMGRAEVPQSWSLYRQYPNAVNPNYGGERLTGFDATLGNFSQTLIVGQPISPRCSLVKAITHKIISMPNQSNLIWKYKYSQNWGKFANLSSPFMNGYGYNIADEMKLAGDTPSNIDDVMYKSTAVIAPDGSKQKHYYNRRHDEALEGKVFATEFFDIDGVTKLKEVQYSYITRNKLGGLPLGFGEWPSGEGGSPVAPNSKPQKYEVFNNSIKTLLYDANKVADTYTQTFSDFNTYGIPKVIHENNGFNSKARYIKNFYYHDTENWLISLPSYTQVSSDGVDYTETSRTKYHSATSGYKSLPYEESVFGGWGQRYTEYHDDGNVKKIEYNEKLTFGDTSKNRYQIFESYKRGIPQTVKVPKRLGAGEMKATRVVDDNGWLTSITDFNNATTGYAYDVNGRLASIKSPAVDEDDIAWLDTVFTWTYDGGTGANQPVRKEERCTLNSATSTCSGAVAFTTTTTYDGLLRPVLVKTSDGTNTVYQNATYNADNQLTFQSYPSREEDETKGVSYSYDALQRSKTIAKSSGGTVTYDYLAGNKIEVTDAGKNINNVQHSTTTTYLAYGSPSYEQAIKIVSPESVTTDIVIDIFGNTASIKQSGLHDGSAISQTEYRAYDAQQRLCQIKRSDVGTTVINRNTLGEIQWQAQGQTASSNTVCNATATTADKVSFTYDNLGSQRAISYGDNTPTRTFTYDGNGAITDIAATGYAQHYNYNALGLLEDESLTIDGKILTLDYAYTPLGHLSSLTYPDGLAPVNFETNAFGQPRKAIRTYEDGSTDIFVKGGNNKANYYPNGVIDSFTYGNNVEHKTEVNDRGMPTKISDKLGAADRVNLNYTYDNNSNITSIYNTQDEGNYSLCDLTYDGLDRLVSTSGGTYSGSKCTNGASGIGSSNITYDGLGNIRTYKNTSLFKPSDLTYDYAASNRLKDVKVTGTTELVRNFSTTSSYDARGNVKSNGNSEGINTFNYNLANQMTNAGGNSYVYDGYNRRVKTKDSKGTSYSMYSQSGKLLYRETPRGGINYIFLGSKLVAKEGTGVVPSGDSIMNYKPFGDSIEESKDDIGYTGHKFDTDLGLSYMQARYYDPVIGRFYSNDPAGFSNVHNFNRYAYANNNPYKYVDPDGRNAVTKFIKQTYHHNGNVIEAAFDVAGDVVTVFAPSSTPMDRIESAISLVSPVDLSDIKAAKNGLAALGRKFGGRKGNIDTRAQNQAIGDNITAKGGNTTAGFGGKESHFPSSGPGNKGGRFSDGSAVDANNNGFQVQTVDTKANGTMTNRESTAAKVIAERSNQPVVCISKTSC